MNTHQIKIGTNRQDKNKQDNKKMNDLLLASKADWHTFFNNIGSLIEQYAQSTNSSNKQERGSIFFSFLQAAFSTDAIKTLTDDQKETLFLFTQQELNNHAYDLTNPDDLKMLYERFNVFLRVDYEDWNQPVLDLIVQYSEKIANSKIVLDKKNEDLDWDFKNLFWILNVNFSRYAKENIDYKNFKEVFDSLKKTNNEIYRWDPDSIFSFRTVLETYRILRDNFKRNNKIVEFLDKTTKNFVSKIIDLTKNQCLSLTPNEIKECTYIQYVKNLPTTESPPFIDLYKKVDKEDVFPHQYNYQSSDTLFKVRVLFQKLTASEKDSINTAISETYKRMENFKTKLTPIDYKKSIEDQTFRLYIFETKEEYIKYGSLWGVNTAGGGYAHVRSPSENERSIGNVGTFSDNEVWYETFIYQQEGDTRNAPYKEGGNFRNLGHEIQHTLFYALLGPQGLDHLPSWAIEGSANALGNEECFKEEADYIKSHQDRLPKIEQITNMSHANGEDLYYFGSALFRFMLEQAPDLLKTIIIKAQEEEPSADINLFIKNEWGSLEADFQKWLTAKIHACSAAEKQDQREETTKIDVQQQYALDLTKNPALINFLELKGPIEFVFHDTVFSLSNNISRYYNDPAKTPQAISLTDYNWFKSGLEINVIENELRKLNLTQDRDVIIQDLVTHKGDEFSNRKVVDIRDEKNIDLTAETAARLKSLLEMFVFRGDNLDPKLKRHLDSLNQDEKKSPLEKILHKISYARKKCENYLRNDQVRPSLVKMFSDAPYTPRIDNEVHQAYQKSLSENPTFENFVKKRGSIQFTFSDTVFELSAHNITRHDLQGNPQQLTLADYRWFKSALELYFIKDFLRINNLAYNKESVAEVLNTDVNYVSNRDIVEVNPYRNDRNGCFPFSGTEFLSSGKLSDVFENRLRLAQASDHPAYPSVFEHKGVNINATSVLGAFALLLSNTSLILNSLVSKPYQLAPVDEGSCDENNVDESHSNGLILGGALATVAAVVIAGVSFWKYIRKKASGLTTDSRGNQISYFVVPVANSCQNFSQTNLTFGSNNFGDSRFESPTLSTFKPVSNNNSG